MASARVGSPARSQLAINAVKGGDPARGKQLILQYQCNRCHDDTGHEPMPREMHCVHCHQDILADKFNAPAEALQRWKKSVDYVQVIPSLEAASQRLRADWLLAFLQQPEDLRPHLAQSMPRLRLDAKDARDLSAYLSRGETARLPEELEHADQAAGRRLLETRGCGNCHVFSGVPAFGSPAVFGPGGSEAKRAAMLAPDLAFVRTRFRPDRLVAWLMNPSALKPGTLMPTVGLTEPEAQQLAAYLLFAKLKPPRATQPPPRLPVLERKVTYAEVDEKVFHVTCRHCHSNADIALGEGGPGNTGGFGFAPKGLNLASYASINSGYKDDEGQRRSIFEKTADGTPRLLAAVLARQLEEHGQVDPEVRGMPLGLPSLSPEQVQLLESWIVQGRPR